MKRVDWREPEAPPLVSFRDTKQLLSAVRDAPWIEASELAELERELARGLTPVACPHILGTLIGVSPKLLWAMATRPSRYYRSFSIPKRSGGVREIDTPRVFLKVVQWWILDRVLIPHAERTLPESVCGFRPGRSTLDAAAPHMGARFLLRCDIEEFFPSVSWDAVNKVFKGVGYGPAPRRLLSNLTTLHGRLPQGAPTSPVLANLAFLGCDRRLDRLARNGGLTYSRYADDLFFSGPSLPSEGFVKKVERALATGGFRINAKKTRVAGPNERRAVTGFSITSASGRPQPIRRQRRELRLMFHRAESQPSALVDQALSLSGWASYVNMYDPVLGAEYREIAARVRSLTR